uniref:SSD domain-containing protein n=1 Tax=Chromera velia CCMP2878 TaxID=1169474 RepID=A0A0G4GS51_9ALVE|eukprot:Cvel_23145.t1-p1 / transcript=Cvel_23145.t1 / gene=Cvel_23145 / organism=Chromera_velia_CCMP2878 / gene_product=Patched domain-containing protein 3, putative / transcript_product=Patched domain-containing protein 3, putative / location=Cvel_scaffold2353:20508-27077(-) / protein_length=1481 / sequence_SO=supercontig / SO=protein_coding / is_pseudo=false
MDRKESDCRKGWKRFAGCFGSARARMYASTSMFFKRVGYAAYDFPLLIIGVSFLVCALLSLGLMRASMRYQWTKDFAPTDSETARDIQRMRKSFGGPNFWVSVLVLPRDDGQGGDVNLMSPSAMKEIDALDDSIRSLKVRFPKKGGKSVQFRDVCRMQGDGVCEYAALPKLYRITQNDLDQRDRGYMSRFGRPVIRWPSHQFAPRPWAMRLVDVPTLFTGAKCVLVDGAEEVGVRKDCKQLQQRLEQEGGDQLRHVRVVSAKGVALFYRTQAGDGMPFTPSPQDPETPSDMRRNPTGPHPHRNATTDEVMGWLAAVEEELKQNPKWASNPEIKVKILSSRSYDDALEESTMITTGDLVRYGVITVILCLYAVGVQFSRRVSEWKVVPTLMGTLAPVLGYLGASGLLYLFGLPHTSANTAVPFLVLGIGVDDFFVILGLYNLTGADVRSVRRQKEGLLPRRPRERVGLTVAEAGMSISLTTATDVLGLAFGLASPSFAIRNFCLFMLVALVFGYLMCLTFFLAFLGLDARREALEEKGYIRSLIRVLTSNPFRSQSARDLEDPALDLFETRKKFLIAQGVEEEAASAQAKVDTARAMLEEAEDLLVQQQVFLQLAVEQALHPRRWSHVTYLKLRPALSNSPPTVSDSHSSTEAGSSGKPSHRGSSMTAPKRGSKVQRDREKRNTTTHSNSGLDPSLAGTALSPPGVDRETDAMPLHSSEESELHRPQRRVNARRMNTAATVAPLLLDADPGEDLVEEAEEGEVEEGDHTDAQASQSPKQPSDGSGLHFTSSHYDRTPPGLSLSHPTHLQEDGVNEPSPLSPLQHSNSPFSPPAHVEEGEGEGEGTGERPTDDMHFSSYHTEAKASSHFSRSNEHHASSAGVPADSSHRPGEQARVNGRRQGPGGSAEAHPSSCASEKAHVRRKNEKSPDSLQVRSQRLGLLKVPSKETAAAVPVAPGTFSGWSIRMITNWYARWLVHPVGIVVVILLWLLYLGVAISYLPNMRYGLQPQELSNLDSPVRDFFKYFKKFEDTGLVGTVFFDPGAEWWEKDVQDTLLQMVAVQEDAEYQNSVRCGLGAFLEERRRSGEATWGSREEFEERLGDWLQSRVGHYYKFDFVWKNPETMRGLETWRYSVEEGHCMSSGCVTRQMTGIRKDLDEFSQRGLFHARYVEQLHLLSELDLVILESTLISLMGVLLAALAVSLVVLKCFWAVVFVLAMVISIDVGMLGYMVMQDLSLSVLTSVILIICAGFAVDYVAHICHAFSSSLGVGRQQRAVEALGTLGSPVFHGAVTVLLAAAPAALSQSNIFLVFFKMITLAITFALAHGIVVVPVLLSLVGPSGSSTVDGVHTDLKGLPSESFEAQGDAFGQKDMISSRSFPSPQKRKVFGGATGRSGMQGDGANANGVHDQGSTDVLITEEREAALYRLVAGLQEDSPDLVSSLQETELAEKGMGAEGEGEREGEGGQLLRLPSWIFIGPITDRA